jgi:Tfp pilus assembly protein PilO
MIMRAYKKYLFTMALVWSAALAVFALAFFFFISPKLKISSKLAADCANKQKLYESAIDAAKEENQKKLADEVKALKNRLGRFVVESQGSANLTFDVSRIAGARHVGSLAVKTTDTNKSLSQTDSTNLLENHIEVSFASDFMQFASFLNDLERHQPVIFVDSFRLTRGTQGDSNHKF